jgi:hypothetical protein
MNHKNRLLSFHFTIRQGELFMKIIITQTVIEFDLPDKQEENVPKPSPNKPFSFLEMIRREMERKINQKYLEDTIDGHLLT